MNFQRNMDCPICLEIAYDPVIPVHIDDHSCNVVYCRECTNQFINNKCPICGIECMLDIHNHLIIVAIPKFLLESFDFPIKKSCHICEQKIEYTNFKNHLMDCKLKIALADNIKYHLHRACKMKQSGLIIECEKSLEQIRLDECDLYSRNLISMPCCVCGKSYRNLSCIDKLMHEETCSFLDHRNFDIQSLRKNLNDLVIHMIMSIENKFREKLAKYMSNTGKIISKSDVINMFFAHEQQRNCWIDCVKNTLHLIVNANLTTWTNLITMINDNIYLKIQSKFYSCLKFHSVHKNILEKFTLVENPKFITFMISKLRKSLKRSMINQPKV